MRALCPLLSSSASSFADDQDFSLSKSRISQQISAAAAAGSSVLMFMTVKSWVKMKRGRAVCRGRGLCRLYRVVLWPTTSPSRSKRAWGQAPSQATSVVLCCISNLGNKLKRGGVARLALGSTFLPLASTMLAGLSSKQTMLGALMVSVAAGGKITMAPGTPNAESVHLNTNCCLVRCC